MIPGHFVSSPFSLALAVPSEIIPLLLTACSSHDLSNECYLLTQQKSYSVLLMHNYLPFFAVLFFILKSEKKSSIESLMKSFKL